jgi:hypothetical protein
LPGSRSSSGEHAEPDHGSGCSCRNAPNFASAGADWAIITEFSLPAPDRFVRDITTFVPNQDGSWRRDNEHHENVLIDTARIPALLGRHGVQASVGSSFGTETIPPGLRVITGYKPATISGAGGR